MDSFVMPTRRFRNVRRNAGARTVFARTGDDGRFRVYTETDPASAMLVVHESGVYELPTSEFQKHPEITLEQWGRIEGVVLWQNQPGVNEAIRLGAYRDEYGYPDMIGQSAQATSDVEGRFIFDRVLPGTVQLCAEHTLGGGRKVGPRIGLVSWPARTRDGSSWRA